MAENIENLKIIKYRPQTGQLATIPTAQPKADFDSLVLAYFLMFARAPRNPNPDADGFYSLGDVGEAPDGKTFDRWCPYSIARPKL